MRAIRVAFVLFALFAVIAVASARRPHFRRNAQGKPIMQFHNGKFRLAQFTDTHYGMSDNHQLDLQTLNITRLLLAAEKPDLVVFTGDTIMNTGANCTEAFFRDLWAMLMKPLQDAGVPWTWVSGNHDDEYCSEFKREWIAKMDMEYDLSLTSYTDGITGVNYLVNIMSEHDPNTVAANLWHIDSAAYNCLGVPDYGCIAQDQIDWYAAKSADITAKNGGTPIPALAFMHIPLQEYMSMINTVNVTGTYFEEDAEGCQSINTGMFSAFKKAGDVQLVTVGHDHDNDYAGVFDGIELVFGRKTGYGCYGPPAKSGARIFELSESPFAINKWIREDDGGKVVPTAIRVVDPTHLQAKC